VSQIRVTKQTSITFYGSVTLGDLRAFLRQCDGVDDTATVEVKHYQGDQRDGSSTTITVHGAA
jgi:hypothetical protein